MIQVAIGSYSKKFSFSLVSAFVLNLAFQPTPAAAMESEVNTLFQQKENISELINYYYNNPDKFEDVLSCSTWDKEKKEVKNKTLLLLKTEEENGNPKAKILYSYNIVFGWETINTTEWAAISHWLTTQENDSVALMWLGNFERRDWKGHPENVEVAEKYYLMAAEKGNTAVYTRLASLYRYGSVNYPANPEKSIEWYTKATEEGDDFILHKINDWYKNPGRSMEYSSDEVFRPLLNKEVDKGNQKAKILQFYANFFCVQDIPVGSEEDISAVIEKDLPEGVEIEIELSEWLAVSEWLSRQEDDALALMWLGNFAAIAWKGHPENVEVAEKYFFSAIEKGRASICKAIAEIYSYVENQKAEKYYLMAVEYGDVSSYESLANLYRISLDHQLEDLKKAECLEKAEKYSLMAGDYGATSVYYNLADMYYKGTEGYPVDLEKAEKYYLMAAKSGDNFAYSSLGRLYLSGWEGHPADPKKAEKYYLKGAKKGARENYLWLAAQYHFGMGGFPKNLTKAVMYYLELLKDRSLSKYIYVYLGNFYGTGWDDQPANLEKAVYFHTKSLEVPEDSAKGKEALKKLFLSEGVSEIFSEGTVEEVPSCSFNLDIKELEEQWHNGSSWFEPLAGKMGWKYGEYLREDSMKTNERNAHKPEGKEHYKNFSETLLNASLFLPKALKDESFIFMTPKAAVREHLLKSFKVYDPLNPTHSDESGVRLYNVCDRTVMAFGNENVQLGDQITSILEGKYSLSALINHHQKKLKLLEKLRAQKEELLESRWVKKEKDAVLDEKYLKLEYSILAKPARQYVWGGKHPSLVPSDCLAGALEKTYGIRKSVTKTSLAKMSKGEKIHPLLELNINRELQRDDLQLQILVHLDEKIAKRVEKISVLEEIVENFQQMLTIVQPKKIAKFKKDYDFLGDMF